MSCSPSSERKNVIYIVTKVDRRSRGLVGWAVTPERSVDVMQAVADGGPEAAITDSDAYAGYAGLIYAGQHVVSDGKDDTYTVESVNADLRHYLARLARLAAASVAVSRRCAQP
jgi:IS1 family transposase